MLSDTDVVPRPQHVRLGDPFPVDECPVGTGKVMNNSQVILAVDFGMLARGRLVRNDDLVIRFSANAVLSRFYLIFDGSFGG